jgi:hypothetical protein
MADGCPKFAEAESGLDASQKGQKTGDLEVVVVVEELRCLGGRGHSFSPHPGLQGKAHEVCAVVSP